MSGSASPIAGDKTEMRSALPQREVTASAAPTPQFAQGIQSDERGGICFRVLRVMGLLAALSLVSGVLLADARQAAEREIDAWTAEHFGLASQALRQNDLETAAKEYELVLSKNPQFAEAYMNLGIVYHQQGRYREAVKVLQTASSLKPDLLGAQVFLGVDKYMVQDFRGAMGVLEKALKLHPADRQAGIYLGSVYLALDEPEKAARQLRRTVKYYPDDIELLYRLGVAYLEGTRRSGILLVQTGDDSALFHWAAAIAADKKHDHTSVIIEYLKALKCDPQIAELYWRLAPVLYQVGMDDLAEGVLARYRALNPNRTSARSSLFTVSGEPSEDKAVTAEYRETILALWKTLPPVDFVPSLPIVADHLVNSALKKQLHSPGQDYLQEALIEYSRGNYEASAQQVRRIIKLDPKDWAIPYLLARAYFLAANYDAAEQVLEDHLLPHLQLPSVALLRIEIENQLALRCINAVVEKEPNSSVAKILLAKSYAASRRDIEAIAAYQEVLKIEPQTTGIHLAIGNLYEGQLKWAAAIQEFQAELALTPDNALALAHLGHAYAEVHEPDRAIEILSKLVEAFPQDGQAHADLGKVWASKGDTQKAIESFERALQCDPTQNNLHYRLFKLYTKAGQTARAQNHLAAFRSGEASKQKKYEDSLVGLKEQSD